MFGNEFFDAYVKPIYSNLNLHKVALFLCAFYLPTQSLQPPVNYLSWSYALPYISDNEGTKLKISPRTMCKKYRPICPMARCVIMCVFFWVIESVGLQLVRGNRGKWKAAANW